MTEEVTIRYFAQFQEITGRQQETFSLEGPTELNTVLDDVVEKYPEARDNLDHSAISVNLETINPDQTTVKPGDEIALLPPFGGGNGE